MGKRQMIETLQMSVSIANDAIESLKRNIIFKNSDNVKLKVENVGLSAQIDRQAILLESFQDKYDSLQDLYEQAKEERETSEKGAILSEVNKPRTYDEIAISQPLKPFEHGDIAHIIHTELGVVYDCDVTCINTDGYPIKAHGESFQPNGKHYIKNSLRSLFTTAEMIEMGCIIPDVE